MHRHTRRASSRDELAVRVADLLHPAGRTAEAIALQTEAAERFAGVGESATTSPEIWRLVDW